MNILLIGGTGFIGPYVVRNLIAHGHEVAVFHRGQSKRVHGAREMLGDRSALADSAAEFRRFGPDVIVDVILSSEQQAIATMDVFRGITGRIVALSSGDVYRACGILHGFEPGPLQEVPLTEESALRTAPQPYRPEAMARVRQAFPWIDDDYDKVRVERVVTADAELPATVLRLPMVYGPGDPLHRLYPIVKRIDDGRPTILIQEDAAAWRGPRGYVENVAAAVALAATSPKASSRIYNVAEPESHSELEWAQSIGRVACWNGSVVAIPKDRTPAHLRVPYNSAQHWTMSTARIREELGFVEPVALDEALARTITWERANSPAQVDPKQFDYAAEDAALNGLSRS